MDQGSELTRDAGSDPVHTLDAAGNVLGILLKEARRHAHACDAAVDGHGFCEHRQLDDARVDAMNGRRVLGWCEGPLKPLRRALALHPHTEFVLDALVLQKLAAREEAQYLVQE